MVVAGFLNLTKSLVHASMDFCTWSNNFLDLNICLIEYNNYYSNLRLKENIFDIDSNIVPIFNCKSNNDFSKLLLKIDKEIIVCNLSFESIDDDSDHCFEKVNVLFLIIETDQQLIIAEELKKEIKCEIFYIFLSKQKIKHKHFLFYCSKYNDFGRTYFYKNYNQILYSKIFSKINEHR